VGLIYLCAIAQWYGWISIRYGGGVAYPKYFGFAYCLKNNASKINLFIIE